MMRWKFCLWMLVGLVLVSGVSALHNLTNLTSSENTFDLVNYANEVTGQYLMGVFIFAIFFVFLLLTKTYDFDVSVFASSSIVFVLSIFLMMMNMLNMFIVLFFLFVMGLSALWMYMGKRF